MARTHGLAAAFEDTSVHFADVTLRFAGENPAARWAAADQLPSTSSYFLGADPTRWIRNASHYARLVQRAVYSGIDAVFYGSGDRLEFDFVIAPHADPRRIRLNWPGARLRIAASGDLVVETAGGKLSVHKPVVHQTIGSGKVAISGSFEVDAAQAEARFALGAYDPDFALTIDPTVETWFFLGGAGDDRVTVAVSGLIAGVTTSALNAGAAPGGKDIFVWDGQNYTVYGGSGDEEPTAAARVGKGYVMVGWTSSRDFPLRDSRTVQPAYGGGARDGFFISNIAYPGIYSSYLGGSGDDTILAVAADPSAPGFDSTMGWYMAGETTSTDFPVRSAIQPAPGGGKDGFVTRMSPAGVIVESTYWGGSGDDAVLAVDGSARACWLGGRTNSPDLRLMNASQAKAAGGTDGFLTRFDESSGPSLALSTYLGGSGDDELRALRLGPDGWVWAAGTAASTDMPVTAGSPLHAGGGTDVWAARFHPVTAAPSFVTYLGGSGRDELNAIAHDGNGELYLTGWTTSTDLPVNDPIQSASGGGEDGFLARIDSTGAVRMLTYAGGAGDDRLAAVTVDNNQRIYAVGQSQSAALPALPASAGNQAANGQIDGLYLKLRQDGIYAAEMVIGRNLSAQLNAVAVAGDQTLQVVVRSSDPSLVQVQGGSYSTFAPVTINAGNTDGETELIVSAPGLTARHVRVRVRPSYLVNPYTSPIVVPLDGQATVAVTTATMHPESGDLIYQTPAVYTDTGMTWRTDQPAVAQVHDSSNSYSQTFSAIVRGVAEGSASVTMENARFPLLGPRDVQVQVVRKIAPVLSVRDTAVGRLMQTPLVMTLVNTSFSFALPVDVRVTTEDPSRLLLSARPDGPRSESLTVTYGGTSQAAEVWAQGREFGTVRVRIEVDGAAAVFANVAVVPGILALAGPSQVVSGFSAFTVNHDLSVTTAAVDLWSTRPYFALYADIARPPAGFAVGKQLPSAESRNRFTIVPSDASVLGPVGPLSFNLNSESIWFALTSSLEGSELVTVTSTLRGKSNGV